MGAVQFETIVLVKGDDSDAYRMAKKEANDYNGHQDGYSGDIQTTYGYQVLHQSPKYGTKDFYKYMHDVLDMGVFGVSKRGNAGCVEIKGVKLKELKKNRGMSGKRGVRGFFFFGWGAE